ncbi:MAG TPA: hypothetical protein VNV66_00480 [Pilimelia sp.]|nr:hypothetical protein [Pilimelia sp.]
MLAIVAAILFGLALLLDLLNVSAGADAVLHPSTLTIAGLLCVALHLAGVGAGWRGRGFRGRRPGRG